MREGDAAIIVATPEHRALFDDALAAGGLDLVAAEGEGRYMSLDAAELLERFMTPSGPDGASFRDLIAGVLDYATVGGRRVRVYGEMVALLWADGDVASTIALEDHWNDLAEERDFVLLCAYPSQAFDAESESALRRICAQHS